MMLMMISAPPSVMPANRGALGSRQLLVYGIYDATGQQSQLLSALKSVFEMIYFILRGSCWPTLSGL